jgi:hypothetical protein
MKQYVSSWEMLTGFGPLFSDLNYNAKSHNINDVLR